MTQYEKRGNRVAKITSTGSIGIAEVLYKNGTISYEAKYRHKYIGRYATRQMAEHKRLEYVSAFEEMR